MQDFHLDTILPKQIILLVNHGLNTLKLHMMCAENQERRSLSTLLNGSSLKTFESLNSSNFQKKLGRRFGGCLSKLSLMRKSTEMNVVLIEQTSWLIDIWSKKMQIHVTCAQICAICPLSNVQSAIPSTVPRIQSNVIMISLKFS